jgi:ferrous iron transport protein A
MELFDKRFATGHCWPDCNSECRPIDWPSFTFQIRLFPDVESLESGSLSWSVCPPALQKAGQQPARSLALENIVPLELMAAGEVGHVVQVDGSPEVAHRLAEMGLREQARILMIQPGSPCIIAVGDHRLSLRMDDEAEILIALTTIP